MGFLATIKGFLKGFFQNRETIDSIFTSVAEGVDKLGLTQQEKADNVKEFVKETLSENTERSKARRDIAKFLILNYVLVFWVALISVFIKADFTKLIIEIAQAFSLGYAFLAIIAFYFGGYYLGKISPKKKQEQQR